MAIIKQGVAILSTVLWYNRQLRKERVTHIHLNSIVFWSLLPFLPKEVKKVVHIRETPKTTILARFAVWVINRYADKVIAITEQCAIPFPGAVVVENPVDMYRARTLRNIRPALKEKWGLPKESFIVSLFAPVGVQKGHDVLLKVLQSLPREIPVKFLCVGTVDSPDILTELKKDPSVFYFGEQQDMDEPYAMTDIILRCEDYLPLGRTVFEGIYAGCLAVLPIADDNLTIEDIQQYSGKQVFLYPARNAGLCAKLIESLFWQYPNGVYDTGFAPTGNVAVSTSTLLHAIKS